ncbi:hypothetical protein MTR_3g032440 [Medicago truncatula]|uniref:Uncharacterized protein n=1 Tax=Medicago truncatula TaxID=3880 RepID=G7IX10_MEDTR|nr:hypothetical protein MTR_3g032440 [Medicago truncatula]
MIGSKSYVNAIKELRLERILACAYSKDSYVNEIMLVNGPTSEKIIDIQRIVAHFKNLSRGTEQTPRQNAKSNAAQDDEQHNAALRRRNHKNTKGKT